jgi:hypothetical protein
MSNEAELERIIVAAAEQAFREKQRAWISARKTAETHSGVDVGTAFASPPAFVAHPPTKRLMFDAAALIVTLDGTAFHVPDPKAFSIFKLIADAAPATLTEMDIQRKVRGTKGRGAVRRRLKSLPAPLRDAIKGNNRGRWLCLPPPP